MHIDLGFPGSFYDVTIFNYTRSGEAHTNNYFEYLLGSLGYNGEDMLIMWKIGRNEVPPGSNDCALQAFNPMHVGYCVHVEWGI